MINIIFIVVKTLNIVKSCMTSSKSSLKVMGFQPDLRFCRFLPQSSPPAHTFQSQKMRYQLKLFVNIMYIISRRSCCALTLILYGRTCYPLLASLLSLGIHPPFQQMQEYVSFMTGIQHMIFYFLRHADKENGDFYNPRLRHQDRPLSEKGLQNAQKMVGYFADKKLAAIYVSGYQRTLQTIAPVAKSFHLVPIVDERLNEIDNGLVDEMTEQEFRLAYPEEWKAFKAHRADFRFPGGETGAEAQSRIKDFVTEKQQQHQGENVLAVSHDGLIRLWMCHLFGIPVYRRSDFQVDLCGLTEVNYLEDEQRWKLIRFNQVCR